MTEETNQEVPTVVVTYLGRELEFKRPSPEQIMVWKRVLDRLQTTPDVAWTGHTVMAELERLRKIMDSLLANRADVLWLDDEMLEGRSNFRNLAPVLAQAVDAFADQTPGNREERRAAAKPKKAARKRAS